FGWDTRVINGHDVGELLDTFRSLPPADSQKPVCVICNTNKGRGVSFTECETKWHYGGLDEETEKIALADLEKMRAECR
ncbi:MAG: transketolase, partial [bacterium]